MGIYSCQMLNEDMLISCSFDKKVKLWDVNSQKNIKTADFKSKIYSIAVINSDFFAISCDDGNIYILLTN